MCWWVGSYAPSSGRQVWGLPSRVEYPSPQGVLLPRVYGPLGACFDINVKVEYRKPKGIVFLPGAVLAQLSFLLVFENLHFFYPFHR